MNLLKTLLTLTNWRKMMNNINTLDQYNTSTSPLKVLVIGEQKSGKTLLCNIIKDALENNYTFRSVFNNRQVSLEEISVDENGQPIQQVPENTEEKQAEEKKED